MAFTTVTRTFAPGHVEVANGSDADNIAYCSKSESRVFGPFELGVRPLCKPGKRNDIVKARELVQSGAGMRGVALQINSFQAIRSGEVFLKYFERKRTWKPVVVWNHGSTGSGKTRDAYDRFAVWKSERISEAKTDDEKELASAEDMWVSGGTLQWFEGYDAHRFCLFDDFRAEHCSFAFFLRLLDRYDIRVPVKGSSRQFLAEVIVITCPWTPEDCFRDQSTENVDQVLRRIDTVTLFGNVVVREAVQACVPHFRSAK